MRMLDLKLRFLTEGPSIASSSLDGRTVGDIEAILTGREICIFGPLEIEYEGFFKKGATSLTPKPGGADRGSNFDTLPEADRKALLKASFDNALPDANRNAKDKEQIPAATESGATEIPDAVAITKCPIYVRSIADDSLFKIDKARIVGVKVQNAAVCAVVVRTDEDQRVADHEQGHAEIAKLIVEGTAKTPPGLTNAQLGALSLGAFIFMRGLADLQDQPDNEANRKTIRDRVVALEKVKREAFEKINAGYDDFTDRGTEPSSFEAPRETARADQLPAAQRITDLAVKAFKLASGFDTADLASMQKAMSEGTSLFNRFASQAKGRARRAASLNEFAKDNIEAPFEQKAK